MIMQRVPNMLLYHGPYKLLLFRPSLAEARNTQHITNVILCFSWFVQYVIHQFPEDGSSSLKHVRGFIKKKTIRLCILRVHLLV